jgi:phosphatidylglycerol lysyltransferase
MEHLLIRYGYLLLFFGVAVEGETFLLAGSFLAHRGIFHLPQVIIVSLFANFAADSLYYVAARAKGTTWLEKRFGSNPRWEKMLQRTQRHSGWLLFFSRYIFGFRILIPAACGALGMSPWRFTLLNLLAGLIWAVPTALLGYYFGQATSIWLAEWKHYQIAFLVGIVLIAAGIMALRHIRRSPLLHNLQWADLHGLVPFMVGMMGVVNLLSAILPRSYHSVQWISSWLPLEVTQRSRSLMLMAGLALIQVTRQLSRYKLLAWYVALISLSLSLLLHITRGLDLHHSLIAGLLLLYLIIYRHRFNALSDPASLRVGFSSALILAVVVYLYGLIGLHSMSAEFSWETGNAPWQEAFRSGVLIIEPHLDPNTSHAARFLGSLQIAGWLARLYVLIMLLRPVILRDRMEAPGEAISHIFQNYSRYSLSAFAIQEDKHHLLLLEGRSLAAYAVRGAVALCCGDPLASEEDMPASIQAYVDFCRKHGWTPCFYEAAAARLSIYQDKGFHSLKMAEEAIIDLRTFSLSGNPRANLRAMVNKATKSGLSVKPYNRKDNSLPELDEQLAEISEEWLSEKKMGEMGFTLGHFSLDALDSCRVFVCSSPSRVEAFCTWIPYRQSKSVVLDLMRKYKDAPAGTMDILLAKSLEALRAEGLEEASLANAPLANSQEPQTRMERGVNLLFENLNAFYGYKNLFQFKKKFAPRWEGRFLIFPRNTNLPQVAYALTSVHRPGGWWELLRKHA